MNYSTQGRSDTTGWLARKLVGISQFLRPLRKMVSLPIHAGTYFELEGHRNPNEQRQEFSSFSKR